MEPLIVDTHLAIWLARDAPVAPAAITALKHAAAKRVPILVSPISAWEVGLLVSRGRLKLDIPPLVWFERLLATAGIRLAPTPPRILVASSFLPGQPPNDPADRIIAATARELGATLLTRDRLLLHYAEQGHLKTIAC